MSNSLSYDTTRDRIELAEQLIDEQVHEIAKNILINMKKAAARADRTEEWTLEQEVQYIFENTQRRLYNRDIARAVLDSLKEQLAAELRTLNEAERVFSEHRVNTAAEKYETIEPGEDDV